MLYMLLEFVEESQKVQFIKIYEAYERKMYVVALSMLKNQHDAEDAVYHSFLKIIDNLEKIIALPCQEKDPYIVTIVKNTARDMLKKGRRYTDLPEEWDAPASQPGPDEEAGFRYLVDLIRAMPETYREVLELCCVLGYSVKDIAAMLKLKENTVSTRLKRGRKLLQEKLRKEGYRDD